MDTPLETALRLRIIEWVHQRAEANGGFLHRHELLTFAIDGIKMPIIDRSRGIRNPQDFASTLSIVASADGPYDDTELQDGFLRYAYQAGDPMGHGNRKLRHSITTGQPLVLFRKELKNIYTPVAPVYVVGDLPEEEAFLIALDEALTFITDPRDLTVIQRKYAVRVARQRLHQPAFRTRVLVAYGVQCAVCRLRHGSLLDAAHIAPDSHKLGVPTVNNGISLCKIHHAAFDQDMIKVSPDLEIHVDNDLLAEVDGPMLKHGIQEMHGQRIAMPILTRDHPDRDLLALRFEGGFKA